MMKGAGIGARGVSGSALCLVMRDDVLAQGDELGLVHVVTCVITIASISLL